jgi:glucose-1-phosphate thymidylyltransferase
MMKGVILAGGHGTRLWPITHTQSKQLIPIANKPLLFYSIEHMVNAGISEIGIIVGHDPKRIQDVKDAVGDGSRWGAKITYIEQDKPRGVAQAIGLAKDFVGNDPFVVYLGDNMLKGGINRFVREFEHSDTDFGIVLAPHKTPERFGVAIMKDGKLVGLVEKPEVAPSNLVIAGIYLLSPAVFEVIEKQLRGPPGKKGEYQITDVADEMLRSGKYNVRVYKIEDWWKDTGQPAEILEANRLVLDDLEPFNKGTVEDGALVRGRVGIEDGSVVKKGSVVSGPTIIGKDCIIGPNSYIGPHTAIGDGCEIVGCEIENTMVLAGCRIRTSKKIVDSIIGANSNIADRGEELPKGYKFIAGENSQIFL